MCLIDVLGFLRKHCLQTHGSSENYLKASTPIWLSKPVLKELHQCIETCAINSDEGLGALFDQVVRYLLDLQVTCPCLTFESVAPKV